MLPEQRCTCSVCQEQKVEIPTVKGEKRRGNISKEQNMPKRARVRYTHLSRPRMPGRCLDIFFKQDATSFPYLHFLPIPTEEG
jgi:hypothetical protein